MGPSSSALDGTTTGGRSSSAGEFRGWVDTDAASSQLVRHRRPAVTQSMRVVALGRMAAGAEIGRGVSRHVIWAVCQGDRRPLGFVDRALDHVAPRLRVMSRRGQGRRVRTKPKHAESPQHDTKRPRKICRLGGYGSDQGAAAPPSARTAARRTPPRSQCVRARYWPVRSRQRRYCR
jgi:hypothetical protein